jgi:hypothetical protein
MWQRERELIRTELTQAQIRKAFYKGVYTEAEAMAELIERGMTDDDARTLLQSGGS